MTVHCNWMSSLSAEIDVTENPWQIHNTWSGGHLPEENAITAAVYSGRLLPSEQAKEFNSIADEKQNKSKTIGDTVGCQAFALKNELY